MKILVYDKTRQTVKVGDVTKTFRGETAKVIRIDTPHKPSSTGFVLLEISGMVIPYYPSVICAQWVDIGY